MSLAYLAHCESLARIAAALRDCSAETAARGEASLANIQLQREMVEQERKSVQIQINEALERVHECQESLDKAVEACEHAENEAEAADMALSEALNS